MKKLRYLLLLVPILVLGQSNDQNWVKSTSYKVASQDTIANPTIQQANVQVSYYDGLGRPIQQIAGKQSNTGKDIVTHIEYDAFGRQTKEFLPLASGQSNLAYIDGATAKSAIESQYQTWYGDQNPYSYKQLENSPLNRVLKQAAPGTAWQMGTGKEIKFDYQTNHATEVKYFKATASWNATFQIYTTSVTQTTNYPANELYKTITFDENTPTSGKGTEEFKDKEGKVVLKRTYNAGEAHDTYYIYDQYGNLSFVLPPLAEGGIGQSVLDNLGYQYQYDYRNRLVAKKLPGKQWEYIVYDQLDRPIATGPAFSPYGTGVQGWMVTQYDAFSRVTQTGWKNLAVTATSRKNYQTTINSGGNDFTLAANDILTKNYYDNYTFTGAPSPIPTTLTDSQLALATNVKGLQTGSWVKVLDNASSTTAEISYTLYDKKYRPVRSYTKNHLGGYTQVDTNMDWAGKTLYTITRHKRTNAATELVLKDMFSYSPQDKLLVHKQKINTLPEQLISSNTYDELGQLISKNVGGSNVTGEGGLQKVDYKYNIRGWLKQINEVDNLQDDLFSFKINYNDADTATDLFNGNISETYWKTSTDNVKRKYDYLYDDLNRLLQADYSKQGNTAFNSYLEHLTYDKNGNIKSLQRNGGMDTDGVQFANPIDNLMYFYDTNNKNLLVKVFDATANPQGFADDTEGVNDPENDYKYDDNGNMTKDDNKKIQNITYNHLNLPTKITFVNGNTITYLYNAAGQKVNKVVTENSLVTTTEYLNGFQYVNSLMQFFPHAEGYVNATQNGAGYDYKYVFNYTDHLGNIRLSYAEDPTSKVLKIIEENHYYPFGLKHSGYNSDKMMYVREALVLKIKPVTPFLKTSYDYKFQGQELQDELGLNWYSYKWRNYSPEIGRFMSIDPLTEEYEDYTPYQFSSNQPVHAKELEGLESSNDLNKSKDNIDKDSFRYKVAEFFLGMVMSMGDIGAASKGKTATTIEQKISNSSDGLLFVVDNSLFIEGVMSINRAPSDGEFSPNYTKSTTEVITKAETGLIYKVPGEATKSGNPYIGKTTKSSPTERGRGATDARDRTKATVIDRYNAKNSKEGSFKEQRAINNNGGVKNLDNKRNEMSKKNYEAYKELQRKKSGK
jgi:RHS repeat-associated protein